MKSGSENLQKKSCQIARGVLKVQYSLCCSGVHYGSAHDRDLLHCIEQLVNRAGKPDTQPHGGTSASAEATLQKGEKSVGARRQAIVPPRGTKKGTGESRSPVCCIRGPLLPQTMSTGLRQEAYALASGRRFPERRMPARAAAVPWTVPATVVWRCSDSE